MMDIVIGIVLIALLVFAAINFSKNSEEKLKALKKLGDNYTNRIWTGKYIHGHPDIDDAQERTFVFKDEGKLHVYGYHAVNKELPIKLAEIDLKLLEDIIMEDSSTMEQRVTVARLALTGLFAFALKKKKKSELAYLIIKWKDGKYKHDTIFEFDGAGSIQSANTARNKLIKITK